jgi:phytoene/squalene synthetase
MGKGRALGRRWASAAAPPARPPAQSCLEIVQKGDKPASLAGLLMPKEAQRGFFAVRALNVELARVAEQVHGNELSAQLRFQWWRDLVDYAFTGSNGVAQCAGHPVAKELRLAVQNSSMITRRWLDRMIDAREEDLTLVQPSSIADMEDYAEKTASSLFLVQLELLGIRDDAADHVASHLGKSVGLSTSLNALPYLHMYDIIRLPRDVMVKHKLRRRRLNDVIDHALELQGVLSKRGNPEDSGSDSSSSRSSRSSSSGAGASRYSSSSTGQQDKLSVSYIKDSGAGQMGPQSMQKGLVDEEAETMLISSGCRLDEIEMGKAHQALIDVTFEVAATAHGHLEHARELAAKLPPTASKAFLSSTWSSIFLQRLETLHFDILHPKLRHDPFSQLRLQVHLLRNAWGKKY